MDRHSSTPLIRSTDIFNEHLCLPLCQSYPTKESKSIRRQHGACLQNSTFACVAFSDWCSRKGRCCLSVCRVARPAAASGGQVPQTFLMFAGHSCSSNAHSLEITASGHTYSHTYVSLHVTVHATTSENMETHTHTCVHGAPRGPALSRHREQKNRISQKQLNSVCAH